MGQRERELVGGLAQRQVDVRRKAAWDGQDEKTYERAVLPPEGEGDENAVVLELEAARGENGRA